MKNGKERFVGIVCARAGSERLPGKNALPINGIPMYDLACRKLAMEIDDVYLLTDIDIHDFGDRPYEIKSRPGELNGSETPVQDVVDWFVESEGLASRYEYIVLLFPTNPYIQESHIRKAMRRVDKTDPSILRSYGSDGRENGLYIIDIDYMQNNSFLYDVYTEMIKLPGKEIHSLAEYRSANEHFSNG